MLTKNKIEQISVYAPGKVIFAGEHAIVHEGGVALAFAVDCCCCATVQELQESKQSNSANVDNKDVLIKLVLADFKLAAIFRIERINGKVNVSVADNIHVSTADQNHLEFFQKIVTEIAIKFGDFFRSDIEINISSKISIGCGMGSSAAVIVAIVCALKKFYYNGAMQLDDHAIIDFCRELENFKHTKSSGIDVYLSYFGGGVLFSKGNPPEKRMLEAANFKSFFIVNTGQPFSSTGECVAHTSKIFEKDASLLSEFNNITRALDAAIKINNDEEMMRCIRENHKLLYRIGVVPAKVQQFIELLWQYGIAAKISGGGAIVGDNAGIVLAFVENELSDVFLGCCAKYEYKIQQIKLNRTGIKVIKI